MDNNFYFQILVQRASLTKLINLIIIIENYKYQSSFFIKKLKFSNWHKA